MEVGEAIDNVYFLLIWISIINSAPQFAVHLVIQFTFTLIQKRAIFPNFELLLILCSCDITSENLKIYSTF